MKYGTMKQIMTITLLIVLALVVVGAVTSCATPLTEEERFVREYNREVDRQNWKQCVWIINHIHQAGTLHDGHSHIDGTTWWEIKEDLSKNHCQRILGDNWINHLN